MFCQTCIVINLALNIAGAVLAAAWMAPLPLPQLLAAVLLIVAGADISSHDTSEKAVADAANRTAGRDIVSQAGGQQKLAPSGPGVVQSVEFQLAFPSPPVNYTLGVLVQWTNGRYAVTMPAEHELCPSCRRAADDSIRSLSPWKPDTVIRQFVAARDGLDELVRPWLENRTLEGNSGEVAAQQMDYIQTALQARARTLCEVGFNAGHGTLSLLAGSPFASNVYAFDIAVHGYVDRAVEYVRRVAASPLFTPDVEYVRRVAASPHFTPLGFSSTAAAAAPAANVKLPRRVGAAVHFYPGDSRKTLPAFRVSHPDVLCDLAHVDGGHRDGVPAADLANILAMMRPGGIILMDDVTDHCGRTNAWPACIEPTDAWHAAVEAGRVTQLFANFPIGHRSERGWVAGVVTMPPLAASS